MLGKRFLKLRQDLPLGGRNKILLFLQIMYLNYIMNVCNKMYYKISVNLIYLTFIQEKKIKTEKTKQNNFFFTINSLTKLRFLFEKIKNGSLFDRAFLFLSRKLTELDVF